VNIIFCSSDPTRIEKAGHFRPDRLGRSLLGTWRGYCDLSADAVPAFGTDKTCPRLTASASPSWGRFALPPTTYLSTMLRIAFEPCIPTRGTNVPAGPDWLHEIKHDGYRLRGLIVVREGKRVRLLTRGGYDWANRYPLIVEAALRNRTPSFVIDGEAVLLGVDGISDFNGLHSRRHDDEVQLYAFDILALDGDDLRKLPLHLRKTNLARLLARRPEGIFVSEFEQGEIGPDLFRQACKFGLEGLVSKRRESVYRGGRSPHWIKVKNRSHPAMERVKEAFS
jgi:bifunctional non-homologous end joining protein LigD